MKGLARIVFLATFGLAVGCSELQASEPESEGSKPDKKDKQEQTISKSDLEKIRHMYNDLHLPIREVYPVKGDAYTFFRLINFKDDVTSGEIGLYEGDSLVAKIDSSKYIFFNKDNETYIEKVTTNEYSELYEWRKIDGEWVFFQYDGPREEKQTLFDSGFRTSEMTLVEAMDSGFRGELGKETNINILGNIYTITQDVVKVGIDDDQYRKMLRFRVGWNNVEEGEEKIRFKDDINIIIQEIAGRYVPLLGEMWVTRVEFLGFPFVDVLVYGSMASLGGK
ncbi:MAG: hypothetical protein ISS25_03160 [Nanoarchaeota archaeon]|nr:hypothetical protein [DPANN group archaeon]MBL7116800.1 hypothetical protein [Nanoarchaeota archaeon]